MAAPNINTYIEDSKARMRREKAESQHWTPATQRRPGSSTASTMPSSVQPHATSPAPSASTAW